MQILNQISLLKALEDASIRYKYLTKTHETLPLKGVGGRDKPGGGPLQALPGEAAVHQPALRALLWPVPD
jgi:hypothetical protein